MAVATADGSVAAAPENPPPAITVSIWIAQSGEVERVSFPSLSDASADADLKTLLMRIAAGAPPSGMLQPVRLRLSLTQNQ